MSEPLVVKATNQMLTPMEVLQEGLSLNDTYSLPEAAASARTRLQAALRGARAEEARLAQVIMNVFAHGCANATHV